ncbi:MAG: hypothetical protein NC177_08950 [Ruminococcus flavefaciens]|nr:hypothetical protein [Ruminococcus flavefaciens]
MKNDDNLPRFFRTKQLDDKAPEIESVRKKVIAFSQKQANATIEEIPDGFIIKTDTYKICAFDRTICINYYNPSDKEVLYSADINMESGLITTNIPTDYEDFSELLDDTLAIIGDV